MFRFLCPCPPSSCSILMYFHFLFRTICVDVVVSACAAILRFRTINFVAKLHLFCSIFLLRQFFIWFFFVFITRCCSVYLCFIDTESVVGYSSVLWRAHFCVYFFQFKTYNIRRMCVCIDYIPSNYIICLMMYRSLRTQYAAE